LGHQAGDSLLQEVAQRLTGCVRSQDTVARLGGDEFTIILEDLKQAEDASVVASKVLDALSTKMEIEGHEIVSGGSIGISIYPDDSEHADSIIKNADMAMYQAKQHGRNRYQFYTEEFSKNATKRFYMEKKLRQALLQNELTVYYQPQVNMDINELIGAEALVRWNDPHKGLVPPNEFIPLAEETGLIEPIGIWVLETACKQAIKWQQQGFAPFRMTVNVSGYQFTHGSIVDAVKTVLDETMLSPQYLELEITESFFMGHAEKSMATLDALRELGISIAIDDFGTGYSSLSYLKRLSIDRLKIDRSFVMDIPDDKDDAAIVSTIIAMAKKLGLSVIAEGVENQGHITFLNEEGCDEMQGFFFSKPLPQDEFEKLFLVSTLNPNSNIA
jgi:predicted signal transduction protein with EAL and GGDEF domain